MLLTACQQPSVVKSDCVLVGTIPEPLWMPDDVVNYLLAAPVSTSIDDWIIKNTTQQEQLEALHGK